MKVCAACADEARRLGLAVEVLGGGEKDNEEKKKLELIDYRSGFLPYCGQLRFAGFATRAEIETLSYGGAMIPTNATIIRKAYDDFARGNIPGVLEAFDPSITWHVPGHSPLAGDYKGHNDVVGFFKHTMELCGGVFAIEVQHVLAEEGVVVALVTVKAERNGRSAAFPEVHVWRLENGKVTEFREFQGDEQTEDRFWL